MVAFDALRQGQKTHGYFGDHTSTIDWCELNYTTSPYIAEFVNTLTNVPVILMGLYGWYASLRRGMRKRYAITYLGLALIGIGSFGFHASLMWEWQLMDELPMIYVVSHSAYLILDTLPSFSPRFGILGPLVLIAWNIFVTFSYLYLPNPIYHQIAFALILLSSVGRNVLLIRRLPPGHPVRQKISRTLLKGCATFAAGFAIWNVDNIFCAQLRQAREVLGLWGVFLQGHGYWHLMTGYGSILIFAASTLLQMAVKVSPEAYDFSESDWFPITRKIDPAPAGAETDSMHNNHHTIETSEDGKSKIEKGVTGSYEFSEDEVEKKRESRRRDNRILRSDKVANGLNGHGRGMNGNGIAHMD